MNNKLTLEEHFLTLDQAKELQDLGIDFDYFNFCYYEDGIAKGKFTLTDFIATEDNVIPTLSVAEMMEMIPAYINYTSQWHKLHVHKCEDCTDGLEYYCIEYNVEPEDDFPAYCSIEYLLRDALFEMLKWLKQNKLI